MEPAWESDEKYKESMRKLQELASSFYTNKTILMDKCHEFFSSNEIFDEKDLKNIKPSELRQFLLEILPIVADNYGGLPDKKKPKYTKKITKEKNVLVYKG